MQKPKYILIDSTILYSTNDFNNKVNAKLLDGYILFGNTFNSGSTMYQAVILPDTDRSEKINKN